MTSVVDMLGHRRRAIKWIAATPGCWISDRRVCSALTVQRFDQIAGAQGTCWFRICRSAMFANGLQ